MELSDFGASFTKSSGILELMDDLGRALGGGEKMIMLGGGNPASIPGVNAIWREQLQKILLEEDGVERLLVKYDTPQGNPAFLKILAASFRERYGWPVTERNLVITHGSQNAFFLLLNFLSGRFPSGESRKILFPLAPEYIGYADQGMKSGQFRCALPEIEVQDGPYFKYRLGKGALENLEDVGAIAASRPTNPTGNVLTDDEVAMLSKAAKARGVPLLIDNAYGAPFPSILFRKVTPMWDGHTVLSMSLSKLGLPATRTGILLGPEELVKPISAANAILNLANGGIGQTLVGPLIENGVLFEMGQRLIEPFYRARRDFALDTATRHFGSRFPWKVHRPEGALFLWFQFPGLSIPTRQLYERLKDRKVLIVPGEYFFFGLPKEADDWRHRTRCIRLNYARSPEEVEDGLQIIGEEVARASGSPLN